MVKWFFGGGRSRGVAAAAAGALKPRLDPRLKKIELFSNFRLCGKFLKNSDFYTIFERFSLFWTVLERLDRFGAFLGVR